MKLRLERISSGHDSTVGVLFLDGRFECFTCEDEYREEKVAGETRIPAGTYPVKLRAAGGMHEQYKRRFSNHEGMLELQGVPNFTYIYFHVGNDEGDTAGCILVGGACEKWEGGGGRVLYSTDAYRALYDKVVAAARAARLEVEVVDRDLREKENEEVS